MAKRENKSLLTRDLCDLPGIRDLRRVWFLVRLHGRRGNLARTLFFNDLAMAVRLYTPMDEALELIARGREIWVGRLARYLLPWIQQGQNLSEAMARLGFGFSRQEIAIVEMGEQSGFLARSLKRLADYGQTESRLKVIKGYLIYPLIIAILAVSILTFILIWIIPKFQDMFSELGGQLPWLTRMLIGASGLLVNQVLTVFLQLVVALLILRLVGVVVQRSTGVPLSYYLPMLSKLYRTVRDARWMAAFTLNLEAGVSADQALQRAGETSGGVLERRSQEAARLVGQGHAIGEACIRCRVLEGWINHRLLLIDWRGNYIEGVRGIVEDADRRLSEDLDRFGRRAEVLSVIAVGAIVGVTVIAIYLPLFAIPKLVKAYY